jgi:hypothetical protein
MITLFCLDWQDLLLLESYTAIVKTLHNTIKQTPMTNDKWQIHVNVGLMENAGHCERLYLLTN